MSNQKEIIIAPSLLAADFGKLSEEIKSLEDTAAKWLHLDVMDGQFVPPITFGDNMIKTCKSNSSKFIDVHLMISQPEKELSRFISAGADNITFHTEATRQPDKIIKEIKSAGISAGISVKPATPIAEIIDYIELVDLILIMSVEPGFGGQSFMPDSIKKITELKSELQRKKLDKIIQVDGGINQDTANQCKRAGATNLVAGTYIFKADNRDQAINNLLS